MPRHPSSCGRVCMLRTLFMSMLSDARAYVLTRAAPCWRRRLAMLGFFAGVCAELSTGQTIWQQYFDHFNAINFHMLLVSLGSFAPGAISEQNFTSLWKVRTPCLHVAVLPMVEMGVGSAMSRPSRLHAVGK
eukprot:scaffold8179_cov430-Prasinococcus_capsulatus_cf.AAC.8